MLGESAELWQDLSCLQEKGSEAIFLVVKLSQN